MRFSIPRALKRVLTPNFIGFDKYRKRGAYHWDEIETNRDYRAIVEAIGAFLRSDQVILDIGCGDGAYLGFAAPKVKSAFGIDAEATAIDLARTKLSERGIRNCQVENLRIDQAKQYFERSGQTFDLVWSADVIEHLPRPEELLELAAQVLRPEALCLIGTPLYISDELVSPYHVKEYTKPEIRQVLSGFFAVEQEVVLPHSRKDGNIYAEGYYLAAARVAG